MSRHALLAATLVVAAAVPFALAPPAEAGRRGDALAAAAKSRRKEFKSAGKEAEKLFSDVTAGLTRGLASGNTSPADAATGFSEALAYYVRALHEAAGDAAEGFAGDAVQAMGANGDEDLAGAVAGDGGSFDAFTEGVREDLSRFRAKTTKRAAKFQQALARSGEGRDAMRVVLMDWTFSPQPKPDLGGAADPLPEPVRLWGATAARLTDGRIVVSVFGSAARERDETFDVRMARSDDDVRPLGDFLRDGGMDVDLTGWWSFTGVLNDPFSGDTIAVGNAHLHFGVEPTETLEPGRLEHAGIISIP